jgi:hypothetical protein
LVTAVAPVESFLVGTWLSLVEHSLGVRGVGSSNLPVPTISSNQAVARFPSVSLGDSPYFDGHFPVNLSFNGDKLGRLTFWEECCARKSGSSWETLF